MFDVKETTSFKIIRQMTDHIWGEDQGLSDDDVVAINKLFSSRGHTWEALMNGSMTDATALENCIEAVIDNSDLISIATQVASEYR